MKAKEGRRSPLTAAAVLVAVVLLHPLSYLGFMYYAGRGLSEGVQEVGRICYWPENWLIGTYPTARLVNRFGEAAMRAHNAGARHQTEATGEERPLLSF